MKTEQITKSKTESVNELINEFSKQLAAGMLNVERACRTLAEAYDIDAGYAENCVKALGIPSPSVKSMLAVGRGKLMPQLLTGSTPGERALAHCDVAIQKLYLDEPVPVMAPTNFAEHRLIRVSELTADQARQVFDRGTLRTLAQQRSYLEANARPETVQVERCYVIKKGYIRILKPCEIRTAEVATILQRLV